MESDDKLLDARFFLNMNRVGALIRLVTPNSPTLEPLALETAARDDINRAIVVFLHATFEDMLRTTARQHSETLSSETLSKIPLSGTSGRLEKFHLGALVVHRGKTVDELLRESVQEYWGRVSFSDCGDVEKSLRQLGLETGPFKFLYPGLDSMMKRRHQIVHEADLKNATDRDAPAWSFADNLLLTYWLIHVLTFHAQMSIALDSTNELQRWNFARLTKAVERARLLLSEALDVAKGPIESAADGFRRISDQLAEVKALLGPPSDDEIQEIARKMGITEQKSEDVDASPPHP
jgi:hypothetical protein